MTNTVLAVLALAWPPAAAWLVLKLFPTAMTRFVEKEIDRRSDAKLEQMKADLQGAYSTLKTSVDVLSTTNSAMRPHIVESVTAVWAQMLLMRTKFAMMVAFDGIFLADEAQQAFSGQGLPNLLEYVRPFAGELHTNPLMREFNEASLDQHRLFIGDRLWLLFYIYRAFLMRNGLLISQSWERRTFVDWRKDSGVSQLLGALLTSDEVAQLKAKNAGGLAAALARIEADFLHEATRVMSGSKAMADSLSDMQAILLLQNATIGKRS